MKDRELLELVAKATEDDGCALRLAVRLGIDTLISVSNPARSVACVPNGHEYFAEEHGEDPYADTRRAIVRAALRSLEAH